MSNPTTPATSSPLPASTDFGWVAPSSVPAADRAAVAAVMVEALVGAEADAFTGGVVDVADLDDAGLAFVLGRGI